jgi:hypothetical protein
MLPERVRAIAQIGDVGTRISLREIPVVAGSKGAMSRARGRRYEGREDEREGREDEREGKES